MNRNTLILILLSVGLSALGQVTMKRGVSTGAVQDSISDPFHAIVSFASSGSVIAGLAMYGVSAVVWLFVLARLDVTMAYPFMALGFLVTMVLGAVFLGEQIDANRLAGTLLVAVGVILVARS